MDALAYNLLAWLQEGRLRAGRLPNVAEFVTTHCALHKAGLVMVLLA